ncbi:hypothetical protein SK128_025467 [Halocaridina rubra]|uniref:Uncharacterized protein n=1 Tax=Halocaridina rubra TaxID=373956 RepID=A0AAN8X4B8_HALRR
MLTGECDNTTTHMPMGLHREKRRKEISFQGAICMTGLSVDFSETTTLHKSWKRCIHTEEESIAPAMLIWVHRLSLVF